MEKVNKVFTNIEKVFNVAECIPGVGIISGVVRVGAGKVQGIAGAVLAGIGLTGMLIHPNKKVWKKVTLIGAEHAIHGALNILRGIVAIGVGATFGGLGSLLLFFPNLCKVKPFSPYFEYGSLVS